MNISPEYFNWVLLVPTLLVVWCLGVLLVFSKSGIRKNILYGLFCASSAIGCPLILYAMNFPESLLKVAIPFFVVGSGANYLLQGYCVACGNKVVGLNLKKSGITCNDCSVENS